MTLKIAVVASQTGAAALAALAIITAFIEVISHHNPDFSLEISNPIVLIGMFIGGILPFAIAAITMEAVGDAAFEMINEIRRQFLGLALQGRVRHGLTRDA